MLFYPILFHSVISYPILYVILFYPILFNNLTLNLENL